VTSGDYPAVFRHRDLVALLGKAANPSHLHAPSSDLTRMRGDKPERQFRADQDSVESEAGYARGDRGRREGQQCRPYQGCVRLRHRRGGIDPSSDRPKSSPAKHSSRHPSCARLGDSERAVTQFVRNVSGRHDHTLWSS
jgi:hypothetical protein